MKKILHLVVSLILGFFPAFALAAYNDVSIDTSTIISVNGESLTISGNAPALESITVDSTGFTVGLQASSSIAVSSPSKYQMTSDAPAISSVVCSASASTVSITAVTNATVRVTLTSTVCGASTSSGNGPVASSGGGGGGGYVAPDTVVPTNLVNNMSTVNTAGTAVSVSFNSISVGGRGPAVRVFQRVLNSDPDTRLASSGAGSPGKETDYCGPACKKAIGKFQVKYNIVKPGKSGYQILGPKTRAKAKEIGNLKGITK